MGIPILNELNHETDRLFLASSRFSKGDIRIKKYVQPLAKMGEKAPVFLKLSEQLTALTECEAEQSAVKLIEIKSLLLSVLSTQGDNGTSENLTELTIDNSIGATSLTYMELAPVLETLSKSGSNRLETIKDAYEKGIFNDPRTIRAVVLALGDGNYEMVDYLIETVIPGMNSVVSEYLYNDFNMSGKSADANKLKAIYKLQNKESLQFTEKCLEEGSDQIKCAAIGILSSHIEYQDLIISLLSEKKKIREAAVNGLAKADVEKGIDTLIEILNGKDRSLVQNAFSANTGAYLTKKLVAMAVQIYETIKDNINDKEAIKKLYAVFSTLNYKKDEDIAVLMKKVLEEQALNQISETMSKEEMTSLGNIYDKSLTILYRTGYGNEFIWDAFIKSQQGLLDKLLKKKKSENASLAMYAFYIGIEKLDAEKYFDTFFKTNLYNDIYKHDRNALENVLRYAEKNNKPVSDRMADYFVNRKEIHNAIRVANIKDKKTVSAIIHYFDENMKVIKNTYNYENYAILQFAGKNKLPEFKRMYEMYCSKNLGSNNDREVLGRYLQD